MRYSLYVYINQMSHSLWEAAEYIGEHPNSPDVTELFGLCRELLDSLSGFLRKNAASVTDPNILPFLEQALHIFASLDRWEQFEPTARQLKKLIRTGIFYRFRVLFLAELGEKWDALESVYQAFCARKDCDPVVVQLPVHRKVKRNGKEEATVLYKDFLTPLGVPFEHYQSYDVSKDCPDLTFHTNPYESTIPSQYWPMHLKEYTRLVYIPYYTDFTVDEVVIESNCRQPMAEYAWRIAALSEEMRKLHQKYSPKQGENLMITGLPKWDHILNMPEDAAVPEWHDKLVGKTVFLWNSHYNMQDNSTLLQNGKAILNTFAGRSDIALIWRPHPMTETMFKMYLPKRLLELWREMIRMVEESDNMVLDQNPMCDVGFQKSHALISDRSSLMVQYMLTGKPVLWLKNAYRGCEKPVIDVSCLETAKTPQQIVAFIDRICKGVDRTREQRNRVMARDMALADGSCGQRICTQTIEDMLSEDFAKEQNRYEGA